MTVNNEISKAFSKHADDYERVAKVQKEIGSRLFERLQYLKITPRRILDLGAPGFFSKELALLYPKAQIVGMDLSFAMLEQARKKQGWRRKWPLVTADMQQMPFATGIFDLVFANQVIHWSSSLGPVFRELNRVMNVNGCLMFTTLGLIPSKNYKEPGLLLINMLILMNLLICMILEIACLQSILWIRLWTWNYSLYITILYTNCSWPHKNSRSQKY